jgi:transporter family-2 protein
MWAIPLLLVVGGLLAVQAAANVQLSTAMRSPLGASTLQLAIGSALLVAATLVVGTVEAFGRLAEATPWHLLGGLGSAIYITAGILLFPRHGALVTVGLFITGQMLASLLLDTFGLLGVPVDALHPTSLLGVLAVLAGGGLIVHARARAVTTASATASTRLALPTGVRGVWGTATHPNQPTALPSSARTPPAASVAEASRAGWFALAVIGGAALPVQGAVNAQLLRDLDAPVTVAAFSFLLAATAMALLLIVTLRVGAAPRPHLAGLRLVPWWGWLGGLAGATYVTSVFLMISQIGAAPTIALTVAGQQLASAAVDQYGLLRLPRRPVTGRRLTGVAVLLAGVALLQLT